MTQPVVLVVFACQSEEIEKLALSAAVGAVQARGMIRLRRLPDTENFEPTAELLRMRKEYVAPAESDVLGADALILASGADAGESSRQWRSFLDLLRKLGGEGKLNGKIAATCSGQFPSLAGLGFRAVHNTRSDALVLGRDVAEKARSFKST
jgi:multimeric flavodoxin WrbA